MKSVTVYCRVRSSYSPLAYFSDIFISGKNVVVSAEKWQHFCQIWKYPKNMQADHNLKGLYKNYLNDFCDHAKLIHRPRVKHSLRTKITMPICPIAHHKSMKLLVNKIVHVVCINYFIGQKFRFLFDTPVLKLNRYIDSIQYHSIWNHKDYTSPKDAGSVHCYPLHCPVGWNTRLWIQLVCQS